MSWLYSRALVEAYSADKSSDGEPSAQLNVMPTARQFSRNDKTMDASRFSRFGLTSKLLTDDHGEALLTSFREASRVRILASLAKGPESTENDQGFGEKWQELSMKYDRDSSSWKTHLLLFDEVLPESSVTLPKWGMMRAGVLLERTMSALRTIESESGFWLTPTKMMSSESPESFQARQKAKGYKNGTKVVSLAAQVNSPEYWPTPVASDNRNRGNLSSPVIARRIEKGKQVMLSMCVSHENGRLNPTWVESYLMGWPIGWTDLKPLETGKFQRWQQQHF